MKSSKRSHPITSVGNILTCICQTPCFYWPGPYFYPPKHHITSAAVIPWEKKLSEWPQAVTLVLGATLLGMLERTELYTQALGCNSLLASWKNDAAITQKRGSADNLARTRESTWLSRNSLSLFGEPSNHCLSCVRLFTQESMTPKGQPGFGVPQLLQPSPERGKLLLGPTYLYITICCP